MGVLALQLVELAEVPGGGSSERGHILYEDHSSSEDVEVHRVSLQCGGPQVVESLRDERHLVLWFCHSGGRGDLELPVSKRLVT